jgi:hypothetical protein
MPSGAEKIPCAADGVRKISGGFAARRNHLPRSAGASRTTSHRRLPCTLPSFHGPADRRNRQRVLREREAAVFRSPAVIAHCSGIAAHCSGMISHCSGTIPDCSRAIPHCSGTAADCSGMIPHCSGTAPYCSGTISHCSGTVPYCSGMTAGHPEMAGKGHLAGQQACSCWKYGPFPGFRRQAVPARARRQPSGSTPGVA